MVWNKFLKQRNIFYKDFQLYLYMIFFDVYFGNVSCVLSAGQIDPVSQDQRRITNKKQGDKQDFTKGFHNLSGAPAGGTKTVYKGIEPSDLAHSMSLSLFLHHDAMTYYVLR